MNYYLGPLMLDISIQGLPHWRAPDGVSAMLHLGGLPTFATGGIGLFVTPDKVTLGKDYRLIGAGDIRSIVPVEKDRSVFASALGLQTVDGTSLVEWLWTALTIYADPVGDAAAKPIMPVKDKIELRLGGQVIYQKPFDLGIAEAAPVIESLKLEYASLRQDSIDGKLTDASGTPDAQKYLRVLDYWGEKYGISAPQDVFVPDNLPKEQPVKHATTLTDSFDRADNASSLGSSSEGWSWTTIENTMGIYTNKARYYTAAGNFAGGRADSDLSSADHYSQGTARVDDTGLTMAVFTRKDSSATLTYYLYQLAMSLTQVRIYKRVSGTFTLLTSPSFSSAINTDYVLKGSANGSTIEMFVDGVSKSSTTDTSITSNLRCGIAGYQNSGGSSSKIGTIDAWTGADISAAASLVGDGLTRSALLNRRRLAA